MLKQFKESIKRNKNQREWKERFPNLEQTKVNEEFVKALKQMIDNQSRRKLSKYGNIGERYCGLNGELY